MGSQGLVGQESSPHNRRIGLGFGAEGRGNFKSKTEPLPHSSGIMVPLQVAATMTTAKKHR